MAENNKNQGEIPVEVTTAVESAKPKKKFYKKKWFWIVVAVLLVLCLFGGKGGSSNNGDNTSNSDKPLSELAVIEDVYSGDGSKLLGQYAYIKTPSDTINEDSLLEIQQNLVDKNDLLWTMVVFTDDETHGVYINNGMMTVGCKVEHEEDTGQYILAGDEEDEKIFFVNESGEIEEFSFDDEDN